MSRWDELPTAEQARRVRFEPFTPLAEIFGTTPEEVQDDPVAFADLLRRETVSLLRAMPYVDYLRTVHWRQLRIAALERAGNACQMCAREDGLEVHHRTYERRGQEAPADLIVLCGECHGSFHARREVAA